MADAPTGLIDQFGKAIPTSAIRALRTETVPVGGQYSRPPFSGHLAFGIDPQRLGAIVRASDNGSSLEWHILAEEMEELFTHYSSTLAKRRRQVSQLPVTVSAAKSDTDAEKEAFEEHVELVRDWLDAEVLQGALFHVLDGVGKGFSVHELIWEQIPGVNGKPGRAWPSGLTYLPQRFFEFDPLDGKTLLLRSENGFEQLVPHKFLVHLHPAKSGNIVRSGIARQVAFIWAYAMFNLKDWALFVQAYGQPIRVGKYSAGASEADKRVLWQAVRSIAGDVAAIIPDSMNMEFVEVSDRAAGASIYEKRMDWLNREVSKLLLGGTAGTEALHGGHAVGQEHRAAEQDVERFDAGLLNVSINTQIIPAMVAFTFGPQRAYPRLFIGRPEETPLPQFIDGMARLIPLGLRVRQSDILARFQLETPEDDDEIMRVPSAGNENGPQAETTDDRAAPADLDPPQLTGAGFLGGLIALNADLPKEELDAMVARLAEDAAGALGGLTDQVKAAFTAAKDMRDLGHRLHRLNLKPDAFGEAMARGMALANLVGQAALVAETEQRRRT